jgi:hypothetical protein
MGNILTIINQYYLKIIFKIYTWYIIKVLPSHINTFYLLAEYF